MFCRIKDGKGYTYNIYLCERKRENGEVKSKDIFIAQYNIGVSLYFKDEDMGGLVLDIPESAKEFIMNDLKALGYEKYFDIVVKKLIEYKQKKYTTYIKNNKEYFEEKLRYKNQRKKDYEDFKKKYQDLVNKDNEKYFNLGFDKGLRQKIENNLGSFYGSSSNNFSDQERKLLKQAFKLLSNKHHPDKGGDTDTMATINNLKEKILK